ncbi:MAG: co-chaperone GroES [Tissierellia bacterium]|nr:co-chaperone GroES [Tissierellia bacterium]
MKLRPLGERVVIELVEAEEKTASGIVLPSSAKEQPQFAKVVEIGKEILEDDDKKDQIKVGDKVIYSKYAGTEVKVGESELTVIKFSDILAVVVE